MFSLNLNDRTEKTYTFMTLTQMYANQVNTAEQRSTLTTRSTVRHRTASMTKQINHTK